MAWCDPTGNWHFAVLSVVSIPQAHRLIITASDQPATIRAEGHGPDRIGVARQCLAALAGGDFPQARGVIITPTGQPAAIGTEGHGEYPVGVAHQPRAALATVNRP